MMFEEHRVDTCIIRSEIAHRLFKKLEHIILISRLGGYFNEIEATKEYWDFVSFLDHLGAESFKFQKPIDYDVRLEPGLFFRITEEAHYLLERLNGVKEGENKKLDDRYEKLLERLVSLDNNSLWKVDKLKLDDNL